MLAPLDWSFTSLLSPFLTHESVSHKVQMQVPTHSLFLSPFPTQQHVFCMQVFTLVIGVIATS